MLFTYGCMGDITAYGAKLSKINQSPKRI
jgi:hypothetical protein